MTRSNEAVRLCENQKSPQLPIPQQIAKLGMLQTNETIHLGNPPRICPRFQALRRVFANVAAKAFSSDGVTKPLFIFSLRVRVRISE